MQSRRAFAVTLVVAMLVAACGAKSESSSGQGLDASSASSASGTTAPKVQDSSAGVTDREITIGVHAPETIGGVDIGSILGLGDITRLYWDTVNEAGGINGRTVKVDLADDGYDANVAQGACRDVVAKEPFVISGTSGADQIITCAKIAGDAGIPYMSLGVGEAGLINRAGYRALTMTYDGMSKLMAEYIVNRVAPKKNSPVAMVRFNSPASEGAQAAFTRRMRELGGNVVATDAVDKQGNANELTAECVKLQQRKVDVVFMILVPTASAPFAKLCAQQGFKPRFVTVSNTLSCASEPPVGTSDLAGCESFSPIHRTTTGNRLAQQALAAWKAKFPDRKPPDELTTFWGLFDIYREALQRAGKNPTRLGFLHALDAMKYDNGLANPIDFRGTHIGAHQVLVTEAMAREPWQREVVSTWSSSFR